MPGSPGEPGGGRTWPDARRPNRDGVNRSYALHLAGLKYMRYISDAAKRIGELDGGSGEAGPHLGLTSTRMKVSYVFDQPFAISRAGWLVDVLGGLTRNVDLTTGALVWKTFQLTGHAMSLYESYIWQENARMDTVSTVRGIQFARETGIEVLTLTAATWATESPKLTSNPGPNYNYSAGRRTARQIALRRLHVARIDRNQ